MKRILYSLLTSTLFITAFSQTSSHTRMLNINRKISSEIVSKQISEGCRKGIVIGAINRFGGTPQNPDHIDPCLIHLPENGETPYFAWRYLVNGDDEKKSNVITIKDNNSNIEGYLLTGTKTEHDFTYIIKTDKDGFVDWSKELKIRRRGLEGEENENALQYRNVTITHAIRGQNGNLFFLAHSGDKYNYLRPFYLLEIDPLNGNIINNSEFTADPSGAFNSNYQAYFSPTSFIQLSNGKFLMIGYSKRAYAHRSFLAEIDQNLNVTKFLRFPFNRIGLLHVQEYNQEIYFFGKKEQTLNHVIFKSNLNLNFTDLANNSQKYSEIPVSLGDVGPYQKFFNNLNAFIENNRILISGTNSEVSNSFGGPYLEAQFQYLLQLDLNGNILTYKRTNDIDILRSNSWSGVNTVKVNNSYYNVHHRNHILYPEYSVMDLMKINPDLKSCNDYINVNAQITHNNLLTPEPTRPLVDATSEIIYSIMDKTYLGLSAIRVPFDDLVVDEYCYDDNALNEETEGPRRKSMFAGNNSNDIKLFPNPAKTEFEIQGADITSLQIFDSQGRVVKQVENPLGRRIEIADLKPGMYMVKVQSGEESKTLKLVKE